MEDLSPKREAIFGMLKRMETLDEITSVAAIGVKVLIESSHFCCSPPPFAPLSTSSPLESYGVVGSCPKNEVNSIFQQLFSIECRKISTTDFGSRSLANAL